MDGILQVAGQHSTRTQIIVLLEFIILLLHVFQLAFSPTNFEQQNPFNYQIIQILFAILHSAYVQLENPYQNVQLFKLF